MSNIPAEPEPQFRGVFVPASAFELVDSGRVTPTEMFLLLTIDRYTKMKGAGCWASNESLAKRVNLSAGHVKRTVKKLIKMGLVERTGTFRHNNLNRRTLVVKYPPNYSLDPRCHRSAGATMTVAPALLYSEEVLNTVDHRKPNDRQIGEEYILMDISMNGGFHHPSKIKLDHSKTKKPTKPIHQYFAKRLREALVKANVVNVYRQSSWAQEFRRLEDSLKTDDAIDQIDAALTWYCKSIKRPYVPLAFSAKSFRSKFPAVQLAMNRDQATNTEIEVTQEALDIVSRIKFMNWPKGTKSELETVVQLSLDRYREFSRRYSGILKVAKVFDSLPSKEQNRQKSKVSLYRFVQYQKIQSPATAVELWLRNVQNRIAFDGWAGTSLLPHVWSTDHKLFKEEWESRAANYGNPKCFTLLIEELSK